LKERIDKAAYEMSFAPQFDQIIINDDLAIASNQLIEMVTTFLAQ
jgi:guanylate kinase